MTNCVTEKVDLISPGRDGKSQDFGNGDRIWGLWDIWLVPSKQRPKIEVFHAASIDVEAKARERNLVGWWHTRQGSSSYIISEVRLNWAGMVFDTAAKV
jgi:hypothetical protein